MRDTNVTIDYKTKLKMHEMLTQQSIIRQNLEYTRYYRHNRLQEKTENVRDTNVTIDYKTKLKMHEMLTQQSIIRQNSECTRC